MAKTTTNKTKAAAARPGAVAKKSTTPKQKNAVARTAELSEDVLKTVEAGQRAAIEAVRKFVDTVDKTLPTLGDRPSRRETLIDAALDMAEKLVTTQYDFLRSVVRSADRSLSKPGTTKK
jgi:myosin-crossreactive antigen